MNDDRLSWCLKQKRGIRVIEPNPNLTRAYLKKATSALNTMTAALKIKETDWIATTAYYARYFALYALLMKIGVKSEIHEFTLAIAKLLAQNGILTQTMVADIIAAKEARIETQYYVETEQNQAEIQSNADAARKLVLETQKIIENLTIEQIATLRTQLK